MVAQVSRIFYTFLVLVLTIVCTKQGLALSSSSVVTLGVPDTVLHIAGYASPQALVKISENGSTIGSTSADLNGAFALSLGGQSMGSHAVQISYTDAAGLTSASASYQVNLLAQNTTNLSVFLAPTLTRPGPNLLQSGSIMQLTGHTVPSATVKLAFDASNVTRTAQANASGYYQFLFDTTELSPRDYLAFTRASKTALGQSEVSKNISFKVVPKTAPAQPDLIVLPNRLSPPVAILPDDGTQLNGNTLTITGQSTPYAQINVYQDGKIIGSVFANALGQWEFTYAAGTSPITLSFEACVDGTCSVQTRPYTYYFSGSSTCSTQFELTTYRFWGVHVNEAVTLKLLGERPFRGTLVVDWGDGTHEKFTVNTSGRDTITKSYGLDGHYNGSVRFNGDSDDCSVVRYFSVGVIDTNGGTWWLWLALIVFAGLLMWMTYRVSHRATHGQRSQ